MSVRHMKRGGPVDSIFKANPAGGFNCRMTDIQAAVGREQLRRLPAIVEDRRAIAARYANLLADVRGLGLPPEPEWARSNWQSYCLRLPPACDQHRVMQSMLDAGVSTRRGIMCSHREDAYAGQGYPQSLLNSEAAQDSCLLLPLFPGMTSEAQETTCAALRTACKTELAASVG